MNVVQLRPVVEADLATFFEHQRDPLALRMGAFVSRERRVFMEHWAHILADDEITKRTITVDGQVAGNVVCFDQDSERHVGYWVGREHWGKGVATRALAAFLLEETRRPLRARAAHQNAASIRVLEKCGFVAVHAEPTNARMAVEPIQELVFELRGDPQPKPGPRKARGASS